MVINLFKFVFGLLNERENKDVLVFYFLDQLEELKFGDADTKGIVVPQLDPGKFLLFPHQLLRDEEGTLLFLWLLLFDDPFCFGTSDNCLLEGLDRLHEVLRVSVVLDRFVNLGALPLHLLYLLLQILNHKLELAPMLRGGLTLNLSFLSHALDISNETIELITVFLEFDLGFHETLLFHNDVLRELHCLLVLRIYCHLCVEELAH